MTSADEKQLLEDISSLRKQLKAKLHELDLIRRAEASGRVAVDRLPEGAVVPKFIRGASTDPSEEFGEPLPRRLEFAKEADWGIREKLQLFRELFLGRSDVYAVRCVRFDTQGRKLPIYQPVFNPYTTEVVDAHLRGRAVIGVYPLINQDSCRFVVIDLDDKTWRSDAKALLQSARDFDVPTYPEVSRSGSGIHLWIFFSELVPAGKARRLGSALMAAAAMNAGSPKLLSYDRMIPAQDRLEEARQIGNLIALPLQLRSRIQGASVFVDVDLKPVEKQWSYLRNVKRLSLKALEKRLSELDCVLGTPVPDFVTQGQRKYKAKAVDWDLVAEDYFVCPSEKLSATCEPLHLAVGNELKVPVKDLSPGLRAALIGKSAFWNPEYLKRRRTLRSVFGIPKKFVLADQKNGNLVLPRGLLNEVLKLLDDNRIKYEVSDQRTIGAVLDTQLKVVLRADQRRALDRMLEVEGGIFVAGTGFGKTVLALALINALKVPTLILVPSLTLIKQWVQRIQEHMGLSAEQIGVCAVTKDRLTGILDVASPRKLGKKEPKKLEAMLSNYGLLIVDECHHAAAGSYVEILRSYAGKYLYGLTATPKRRDGKMPAVRMLIGNEIDKASVELVDYKVVKAVMSSSSKPSCPDASYVLQVDDLVADMQRTQFVTGSVIDLVRRGRRILVLTERVEHMKILFKALQGSCDQFVMLTSDMKPKQRQAVLTKFAGISAGQPAILLATGGLAGEGFDCPILDALVIALPISWEGKLEQYVGRLLRPYPGKRDVMVIDIVDVCYPTFRAMWRKREANYRRQGFDFDSVKEPLLFEKKDF